MREDKTAAQTLALDISELWHVPVKPPDGVLCYVQCSAEPVRVIALAAEGSEITGRYRRCPRCFNGK